MEAEQLSGTISPPAAEPVETPEKAGSLWSSPFLWGGLSTAAFYAGIPYLPAHRDLVERYFCGHPMEYLLAGLFFLGMAILILKALGNRSEQAALQSDLVASVTFAETETLRDRVSLLEEKLRAAGRGAGTVLGRRLRDICLYLRGRNSSRGLNEHLQYLAEVASERLHAGYALVRTITWAIPILGFLGTVIGITLAISNLTPEQLDSSLSAVTAGLGVAFDTTALALALSVVLVFTAFLVERSEQQILRRVEEVAARRFAPLFVEEAQSRHPLAEAELLAAQNLLEKTNELVDRQTALWREALESTRQNWLAALQAQKSEFDATLRAGTQAALNDHAAQLQAVRSEFLTAFRGAVEQMQIHWADARAVQQELHESFHHTLHGLWCDIQNEFRSLAREHRDHLGQLAGGISEHISGWQRQLQQTAELGREQLDELQHQRETLLKLAAGEERLAQLQQRLTENLSALQATENFEQTLHSLSAAVHLLTARVRPQAA